MNVPEEEELGTISDTRRAEAFSDGVLAIVITLLILELHLPKTAPGQLLAALLRQWPTYLAYMTSYAYIAVIWLNHKHAFNRIRRMNRGLHWANLGILFTTALFPFATAVVSRAVETGNPADERTAVMLYALVGALVCGSWLVFFLYLDHHPQLHARGVPERFFRGEFLRAGLGVSL